MVGAKGVRQKWADLTEAVEGSLALYALPEQDAASVQFCHEQRRVKEDPSSCLLA